MARILDKVLTAGRSLDRKGGAAGAAQSEKVDRRDLPGGKSRNWVCGVRYKTSTSKVLLERWLEEHATGEWALTLEDLDDNREVKTVKVLFAKEADKAAFTEYLKSG